jgi:hypothetical protein
VTLDDLLAYYRQLLHLPDPTAVLAALGTVAANQLPGDPVWTLLVGPPSSGKTEIIDSLRLVPKAVSVSTVTKASLLSGRTGGRGGLLLTHFSDGTGLLLVKDLTSILSEAPAARAEILATLREVFDGHVTRAVGTRDDPLEWAGKLGFLGAVTEEIEQHRAAIGLMGDRFVYVPMPSNDTTRAEVAHRAITNGGKQPTMRQDLAEAVATFITDLDTDQPPTRTPEDDAWLVAAADFASRARSPVLRDQRTREIELVPEPELPARLVGEFSQLWNGLTIIGATDAQTRQVILAAALGGIPKLRRHALLALLDAGEPLRTAQVMVRMRTPEQTTRRALDELAALCVIDAEVASVNYGQTVTWSVTPQTGRHWDRLTLPTQINEGLALSLPSSPTLFGDVAPGEPMADG